MKLQWMLTEMKTTNLLTAAAESTNPMETNINLIVILGFAVLFVVVGGFFLFFAKMSRSKKK